jgi:hypothetical protein
MSGWSMGEIAIRYLEVCVNGCTKLGEQLSPSLFKGRYTFLMAHGAIPAAMDYAAEQGWIEKPDSNRYRLTDAGFIAADLSSAEIMSPLATLICGLVWATLLALLRLGSRVALIVLTVMGMRWWSRRRGQRASKVKHCQSMHGAHRMG